MPQGLKPLFFRCEERAKPEGLAYLEAIERWAEWRRLAKQIERWAERGRPAKPKADTVFVGGYF
jgi:hypothetical protein